MKPAHLFPFLAVSLAVTQSFGATTASFNGGADTTAALQLFGDPGGPTIQTTGGLTGGYLQLTPAINGQNNFVTFDRTDVGTYPRANFSFNFRIQAPLTPSAD